MCPICNERIGFKGGRKHVSTNKPKAASGWQAFDTWEPAKASKPGKKQVSSHLSSQAGGWSAKKILAMLARGDPLVCRSCRSPHNLTVDHIVPKIKGGTNALGNLQILCRKCNGRKGDQVVEYPIPKMA